MEKKEALANYLGVNVDDIEDGYDESNFEVDGAEYQVLTDMEADQALYDYIDMCIDDMGLESFTPNFQEWIINHALDNEKWFEEALQEDMEYYVYEMEEDELIQELLDEGYLSEDDVTYDEDDEDHENPIIIDENKLQDAREEYIEYLVEGQGDPFKWYIDNFGQEGLRDLIKDGTIGLDVQTIADECARWDGRGHFLSGYDGNELELEDGYYAYRTN